MSETAKEKTNRLPPTWSLRGCPTAVPAWTRGEARAAFKRLLGQGRLPPGVSPVMATPAREAGPGEFVAPPTPAPARAAGYRMKAGKAVRG